MGETFSVHLDKVTEEVIAAIPGACVKAMEHLHQVAVTKTPHVSGNLAGGSHVDATPTGANVTYEGPYARYQEFGVSKNGHPLRHDVGGGQSFFLVTSVVEETPKVLEILTAELDKVIR